MITYNNNRFFLILFRNIIPYHVEEALRNTLIMTLLSYIIIIINEESDFINIKITQPWINTLSVIGFFLFMFIAFRLNTAFIIWNTSISLIIELENEANNLMNKLYSSIDFNDEDRQYKLNDLYKFKNTLILYIANIFSLCNGSNGRSDKYRTPFLTKSEEIIKNEINATIILMKEIDNNIVECTIPTKFYIRTIDYELRKQINLISKKYNLYLTIIAEFYNQIDILSKITNNLYKISYIPDVFIFNQFINFIIIVYIILYTCTTIPESGYWAGFWVAIFSFVLFLSNSVCSEINTPFGTDLNDIELEIILINIKNEYEAMYNYLTQL